MLSFTAGRTALSAEPGLCELARPRCHLAPFAHATTVASWVVRRVDALSAASRHPLEGSLAPWGWWALEGRTLLAHIPDDPWAAESVLRLAWQLATDEAGGVLMHGCCVGWRGKGVAAIGHSTAGKSTLAALCAGTGADLLTDEIVQLFPDGTCFGTPFRSNVENVGQPGPVKLASLLLLHKAPHEALTPVEPMAALTELLPQLYGAAVPGISNGALKSRVMAVVDAVGVHRLSFRKDPAVGPFLEQWVSQR